LSPAWERNELKIAEARAPVPGFRFIQGGGEEMSLVYSIHLFAGDCLTASIQSPHACPTLS
jgi:hypothetical protein